MVNERWIIIGINRHKSIDMVFEGDSEKKCEKIRKCEGEKKRIFCLYRSE